MNAVVDNDDGVCMEGTEGTEGTRQISEYADTGTLELHLEWLAYFY